MSTLMIGDVVVMRGAVGGPAMRIVAFGYANQGLCVGPTAKVASVRPADNDPGQSAWTGEFLISSLRRVPNDDPARAYPYYDFSSG